MKKRTRKAFVRDTFCIILAMALIIFSWGSGILAVHADGAQRTFDIGVNPESVTAVLDENGLLTISGTGEIRDYTPETAPFAGCQVQGTVIGPGITSLGSCLFYNCRTLQGTLVLPKGLVRIGDRAFSGDSAALAPRPDFVENLFTEALVTRKKAEAQPESSEPEEPSQTPPETAESSAAPEETVSQKTPETSAASEAAPEEAVSQAAPEMAGGRETSFAAGQGESAAPSSGGESSAPENRPEEVGSQPEETSSQPEEVSSQPEEESGTSKENRFTVEQVTEQEVGREIFFPGEALFYCSAENESFRKAMQEAGFREAQKVLTAVFAPGEGSCEEKNGLALDIPVLDGKALLPGQPLAFTEPQAEALYAFSFSGWTEEKDAAGTVRPAGSWYPLQDREELYFIANWAPKLRLEITTQRSGDTVLFSVNCPENVEILSYRWQWCAFPAGRELPADEDSLAWEDLPGETEAVYARTVQAQDGNKLFRCVVAAREQKSSFFSLFSAGEQEQELSLAAVRSGAEPIGKTLTAVKGTGLQTVSQKVSLPATAVEGDGSTVYKITWVELTGSFTLVGADDVSTAAPGSAFALQAEPTGSGWKTPAAGEEWGADLLTELPQGETAWNSGVEHVWKRGTAADYPATAGAGDPAELTFTMTYNGEYETFSGGQIALALEEYSGTELKNSLAVTLTLEDRDSFRQTAFAAGGRSFRIPAGTEAFIVPQGAVTAGFETLYYPEPAQPGTLYLYRQAAEGGEPEAAAFPGGARLVLADLTEEAGYAYYSYTATGGESQLELSAFTAAAPGTGNYSGRGETQERVRERLAVAVDFAGAASGLAAGRYFLTLGHGVKEISQRAEAAFTVVEPQPGDGETAAYAIHMTARESGAGLELSFTAAAPEADTRYGAGKLVRLRLLESGGNSLSFPAETEISGSAEHVSLGGDGNLTFRLPDSGASLTLGLSKAASLTAGDYKLRAELFPWPGSQSAALGEAAAFAEQTVTLGSAAPENNRALTVALGENAQRVVEASAMEGDQIELPLVLNYSGAQENDTLQLSLWVKTGKGPGQDSYGPAQGCTVTPAETVLAESEGTVAAVVTVPKGQAAGTYRMVASIVNSGQSGSLAEQPFNFIVK